MSLHHNSILFVYIFLVLHVFVTCVTEEDEGVKYANRCEGKRK